MGEQGPDLEAAANHVNLAGVQHGDPGRTPVIRTPCPGEDKMSASAGKTEIPEFSQQRLAMDA